MSIELYSRQNYSQYDSSRAISYYCRALISLTTGVDTGRFRVILSVFFLNKAFPGLFIFVFSIQLIVNEFADDWIRTAKLCVRSDSSTNCATTTAQEDSLVHSDTPLFE